MTRTGRGNWAVAVGALAGAGLVAVGLGVDVLWLVWLGAALALLALCLWPLLGARRGRDEPQADSGREEPFVGRVSGADTGVDETSGAERRSRDSRGKRPRT